MAELLSSHSGRYLYNIPTLESIVILNFTGKMALSKLIELPPSLQPIEGGGEEEPKVGGFHIPSPRVLATTVRYDAVL